MFVGFDAEEQGLLGAKAMLEAPPMPRDRLAVMINLDMIGRPLFYDRQSIRTVRKFMGLNKPGVGVLGADDSPPLLAFAREACEVEDLAIFTLADYPLLRPYIEPMTENRDDSAPFRSAGIPTLFFSTSEHDDYHLTTDTPDKVDPAVALRIARAVYRSVRSIDALDDTSGLKPEGE